jgi:hypothetical protein
MTTKITLVTGGVAPDQTPPILISSQAPLLLTDRRWA